MRRFRRARAHFDEARQVEQEMARLAGGREEFREARILGLETREKFRPDFIALLRDGRPQRGG